MNTAREASALPPGNLDPGIFYTHLDAATPVTVATAAHAVVGLRETGQPRAIPFGSLQGIRCTPPSPSPTPPPPRWQGFW